MAKRRDKLIDKLKLENLNIENLKSIIDYETQSSHLWSLNDQLDAIDLLGYTASQEALSYLQKIYKPAVTVKQRIEWKVQNSVPKKEINLIQHHNYPNARGPLASALHYEIPLFNGTKHHLKQIKSPGELEYDQRTIYEKSLAHGTLLKALERLERSVFLPQD